jgi:uncharacterized protein
MSTKEIYKKELISIIHHHIPKCSIYLFGSRARNTHRPGSDIDLAIDAKKIITRRIIANILEEIDESTIPFCVDIVDINAVDQAMKEQILTERTLWS